MNSSLARLGALAVLVPLLSGCLIGERPTEPDADFDYLPDSFEIEGWDITIRRVPAPCDAPPGASRVEELRHVTSDPVFRDTEEDGVTDVEEYQLQSDPRVHDTDGDGLSDKQERDLDSSGTFELRGHLRLWDVDSDGDCIPDNEEYFGYLVPGLGNRTSDPTVADTDHDGWRDAYERDQSHTDPRSADTDGDGAPDRLDADPLQDVWLNLTFHRLLVKAGPNASAGSEFDVTFHYLGAFDAPTDPPRFHVVVGANATVPTQHGPGLQDVNDTTAVDHLRVQFYVLRTDGKGFVDVNPVGTDPIATLNVFPRTHRWETVPAGKSGSTDAVLVFDTVDARIEFTLAVVAG